MPAQTPFHFLLINFILRIYFLILRPIFPKVILLVIKTFCVLVNVAYHCTADLLLFLFRFSCFANVEFVQIQLFISFYQRVRCLEVTSSMLRSYKLHVYKFTYCAIWASSNVPVVLFLKRKNVKPAVKEK